jgi:simple sugar transport system ATP-binding protein
MTAIQESVDTAVLMVSDELDELALCDRVLVMFAGEIVGEFEKGWDEHQLVSAIEGI